MGLIFGRPAKPREAIPIAALAALIGGVIYFFYRDDGIPGMESAVMAQFSAIESNSPNLRGITLARKLDTQWSGGVFDLHGHFQYYAHKGDDTFQLRIDWKRGQKIGPITSIEIMSASEPEKLLWSR
jgi:hypothetical protein